MTLDVQTGPPGQVSILGQVAAEDQDEWTGAGVELKQANQPLLAATLDDLGAFRFEAIRISSIQLTVTARSGVVLQSPDIEITL